MTSTSDRHRVVHGCIALAEIPGAPALLLSAEDIHLMKQAHDERFTALQNPHGPKIQVESKQFADRTGEGQKTRRPFMRTQFNLSQLRGKRWRFFECDCFQHVRDKIDTMKIQLQQAVRNHYNIRENTKLTVDSYLFCVLPGAEAQEWHVDAPKSKHYWTVMSPLGEVFPEQGTTEFHGQETPSGAYFFSGKTEHRGGANNSEATRLVFSLVMYTGEDPNH
jgi:hypothetical protein